MDIGLHCAIPGSLAPLTGIKPASMRPFLKLEAAAIEEPRLLKTVGEPIHQPELNHKAAVSAY
ncbi:hypothetical protein [Mesorhizobium sp.]|uniref:hypothetical protein n=1 Tax=Mesorhizobium sp. TaxID=1871066 RepID=UPI000FE9C46F|nr:hypothetical protein [Mesorhizobium sp.]RWK37635.1 MAG: hypothetical protein EOR46_25460 [Mesorhizobium sp.]RWK61640.1 MAG: hypothetical protein EOR54_32805 [Mesorhizobium sp.]RWK72216.1 MAG: hypothetical protein EOR50_29600 [Mesorhizobium sp.]RWK84653.1 MAG: hypothetical protein EOR51_03430 [Mesorhizobium sp.]RWL01976.1 MAG: hypothetical protein EOR55_23590 [Mesorhizobium sp.]